MQRCSFGTGGFMSYIVVFIGREWEGRKFEHEGSFQKIGITDASPDCLECVPCRFSWGEAKIPRVQVLFIDKPNSVLAGFEENYFEELLKNNKYLILEVLLDLLGGIIVRNQESTKSLTKDT